MEEEIDREEMGEETEVVGQERKTMQEGKDIEKQVENGANWFFVIAALSLVNSMLFLARTDWAFFFGLGITQVIDGIAMEVGGEGNMKAMMVAFALDVMVAALFVLFGMLARRRFRRAFLIGMVLYGLDALLFLLVGDFLGLLVHVVALFGMFKGLKAAFLLKKVARDVFVMPDVSMQSQPISLTSGTEEEKKSKAAVWPLVIAIISFIYVIFFALLTIRNLTSWWKIGGCMFVLGGIVGIWLRKKRGMHLMLIGAVIILGKLCYNLFMAYQKLNKPVAAPEIIGILTVFLVLTAWPIFLLIWFSLGKVREHVNEEWNL